MRIIYFKAKTLPDRQSAINGAQPAERSISNINPGATMSAFSSDERTQFYKSTVSIFFSLVSETFEGAQKLAELNLQAGRSILAEGVAHLQEMKPDTASTNWLASPLRLLQSAAEKTLSYQLHAMTLRSRPSLPRRRSSTRITTSTTAMYWAASITGQRMRRLVQRRLSSP
jgi:phasin family protein